ncbi:MAG TPA: tetratricopeptide repeat protein [Flavobacteriaceae bacterium]|nr:tetratricopeptide repeat protein [Flavobacteriaceae bacterium]HIN97879.1 tetratricopeptide repeat protein [Flavobacteriaceae bacterium]
MQPVTLSRILFFRKLVLVILIAGLPIAIPVSELRAQNKVVDSLEQVYVSVTDRNEKIETLLLLSDEYLDKNVQQAKRKLALAYELLQKETDPKLWIKYHLINSVFFRIDGAADKGILSARKALQLAGSHPDSSNFKAQIYNSLGALYDDKSDAQQALEYQLKALRYAEAGNDEQMIATISNGIGRVYLYLSEYEKAKTYYLRAIEIKERRQEYDKHLANSYNNLSNCFDAEGRYDKSLQYLDKSIQLKEQIDNTVNLIPSYNNKAYTLLLMNKLDVAEKTIQQAIFLADSLDITIEKQYAYSTYAEILFAQNRVALAEAYMSKSIAMSKESNDLYLAKYNLDLMYNIYLKKGDYKKALEFYRERSIVLDSVYNINKRSEIEKLALEYGTEKKNKEIALLNAEKELNEIDLKKSRQLQLAFLLVAGLAVVVLLLLWSRHKNKAKTDQLLKETMARDYEKKLSETELQALRAQMNPHFLFNCLNSINSFIIKNEQEQASEYLSKFSMLIRKVLNNSKSSKVTLANELEALKLYIELESLRFGNSFEYSVSVDPTVETDYLEIPPLIIQPYVENSIWHGLLHKTEGPKKLSIDIKQDETLLICIIEDNGIGRVAAASRIKNSVSKRKSFGMNITKERLEHINQKHDERSHIEVVDLKSESGDAIGTRVTIKIAI